MKQLFLFMLCCVVMSQSFARDPMQYGRAYLAEGDSAASAQSYTEALRLNPFDPVALNNLAVAKAAAGDYQTARDLLLRAARLAPKRDDIQLNLAHLQSWMETYGSAVAPAKRLPTALPGVAAVLPEPPALWSASGGTASSAGSSVRQPGAGNACWGAPCK